MATVRAAIPIVIEPGVMTRHPVMMETPRAAADGGRARGNFRLSPKHSRVGALAEGHRAGWPYVIAALAERQSGDGIVIDDFVENTFRPGRVRPYWLRPAAHALKRLAGRPVRAAPAWTEPWIGIFHLPPRFPDWFDPLVNPRAVFAEPNFRKSLAHLRGAVAFSEYHAAALRAELAVPTRVVKHPTEHDASPFDWDRFAANPTPKLVQVGWYLRNYRAIYQVPAPPPFRKVHLQIRQKFVQRRQRRVDRVSPYRHRPEPGHVEVVSWLPNPEYDRLLSENILFLELVDASANNTIVEALVRTTPVVVNRHPAVQEYLGSDYPLFYDDLREVPDILNKTRIRAAHEHMKAIDKRDLRIEHFVDVIDDFASTVRTTGGL